ncbi:hypothetical protein N9050_08725 [Akkermansiaceae bacterium]|nr:hypothetical protein [Akkermansiaceae bacterium]
MKTSKSFTTTRISNSEAKELCLNLAYADKESEVISLLEKHGLWDNQNAWQNYGGNENNYSDIGNQMSNPDSALVEKLINSGDAMFLLKCAQENIDPESSSAPNSITEGLKRFFKIPNGKLSALDKGTRNALSKNIGLISTGSKTNPSYAVFDKGIGQAPSQFPDTFLSLTESNKIRIQFVQGKFGMGSTGVLRFCGDQNLQLIISRRHPDAHEGQAGDDKWGFTVIRRENPTTQMKSSVFTYLAPEGNVLSFKANSLPLLPMKYPDASGEPFEHGSFIKMYEYNIGPALRSTLTLDLFNRLSLLVPGIALPVRFYERRKGYKANSAESALSGLTTRVETDRSDNLEKGFPADAQITIDGHKMAVQLLAFKKGKREKYSRRDGVLFTQHGQNHGSFDDKFFTRKTVGMSYLHKDLLVIVDCSDLPGRSREDLFMNSRDRLCDCELKTTLEKELISIIKDHKGLKSLREKRKKDAIASRIGDSKPVVDVLSNLLKDNPTLSNLLGSGKRLTHPFSTKATAVQNDFTGKRFPTYFTASKKHTKTKPKQCHQGSKFRVSYETDANNGYFTRDDERGTYELLIDGIPTQSENGNLWNGHFNLHVALPQSAKAGQIFEVKVIVDDPDRIDPIEDTFWVEQVGPQKKSGTPGSPRKPSSSESGDKNSGPSQLDLPPIIPVKTENWEEHKFDTYSALKVIHSGKGNNYDFFYNADNIWLKTEQKRARDEDTEIIETQYKSSLVLIGLSLLQAEKSKKSEDESVDIEEKIFETTSALSPLLIPMIRSLGGLTKDD